MIRLITLGLWAWGADASSPAVEPNPAEIPNVVSSPDAVEPAQAESSETADALASQRLQLLGALRGPPAPHRYAIGRNLTLESTGQVRALGYVPPPDVVLNPDGLVLGQGPTLDVRIRTGFALEVDRLRLSTQWDLVAAPVVGDPWDIPGTEDRRHRESTLATGGPLGAAPREAALAFAVPQGFAFSGGLQTSHWGLGVLANDGAHETLFGRVDRGDRMLRVRGTFLPWTKSGTAMPLFVTLAADQVVEDDLARWGEQRAWQVIGSVLWADPKQRLGAYVVYRHQTEPGVAPRPTRAAVADVYGDWSLEASSGWSGRVAFEAVGLFGTTQLVLPAYQRQTRVLSGGGALETELHNPSDVLNLHLRAGATTATGDPDQGTLSDFAMDSNYNVGLVLFDEVSGALEAATWAALIDEGNLGQPPFGAELQVSEGAVRRAAYLQPAVVVRPAPPLDLRLGMVAAWSTGPVAWPFTTSRAGGEPRNQLDQPTAGRHYLGTEIDWAVGLGRMGGTASWKVHPRLTVEGGHAFVGPAWGGGTFHEVLLTGRLDW
jgi:hypothetical protein